MGRLWSRAALRQQAVQRVHGLSDERDAEMASCIGGSGHVAEHLPQRPAPDFACAQEVSDLPHPEQRGEGR
eukprot:9733416-Lingulodinium_polyedra.AAC.1